MKIITVPEDVKIGEKSFSCKEVLLLQLDNYGEVKTISMVRQAQKVAEAIEKGNGTITLENAEYDLLKAACQKIIFLPGASRKLLPYFEAVESAQEVEKK